MKYGVFGTGMVGLAIANRLAELGHEVMIGTREPSKSVDKLKSTNVAVKVRTFSESAAFVKSCSMPRTAQGHLKR